MSGETLLTISGGGVPPYAVRGLSQTLTPIDAAKQFRRTVNGELIDLSASQFRPKYKSTISCDDQQSPAFDGVNIGAILTIGCVAELSYLTSGGSPARPVVSGSSRVEGSYTFYRPSLTMMLVGKTQSTDEYGAAVSWTAEFEEV